MAGESDKTEKATPRRRQKAREEGQVPKSTELSSAVVLTIAFGVFLIFGPGMYHELRELTIEALSKLDITSLTITGFMPFLHKYLYKIFVIIAPLLGSLIVIGIAVNMAQSGPLFTTKPLSPNPSKINPVSGFKRIFSLKGFVELIKGILKMAIVGGVVYFTIMGAQGDFFILSHTDLDSAEKIIYNLIFSIFLKVCIILLVLGILDFIYQKYEFEKSIRMSKQDIKDEYKNIEGNPQVKQKIKGIQIQMAQSRMMSKIKDADVVVTNPTHFAIALKYDIDIAPAPIVVAKGADYVAKRIKELAKEHKVPIIENKPLARSLYKMVEINHIVAPELFVAVAEVLAYVYKRNKKKLKRKKVK